MKIQIWNPTAKQFVEVNGSCQFEMHGEKFAAHRSLRNPDLWRVSHVETGAAVCPEFLKRNTAIENAQNALAARTTEAVRAAVETFRESLKVRVAEAQEEERQAEKWREERKATRARKVSEMSKAEVRAVAQQAADEVGAVVGKSLD